MTQTTVTTAAPAQAASPSGDGTTWLRAMARLAQVMAEAPHAGDAVRSAALLAAGALRASPVTDQDLPAQGLPDATGLGSGPADAGPGVGDPTGPADLGAAGCPPCLVLPLVVDGQPRGSIRLVRGPREAAFTPAEAAFADALSLQICAGLTQWERLGQARTLALTDTLTGLANRRAVDLGLRDAMERHRHDGTTVTLIMCDLNGLKRVNDTHGHEEGDRLIRNFAAELARCARLLTGCIVARLGGDEFCVLASGHRTADVLAVADRVCRAAGRLGQGDGVACGVASTAHAPRAAVTPDGLLRLADAAQYRAKQEAAEHPVVAAVPDHRNHVTDTDAPRPVVECRGAGRRSLRRGGRRSSHAGARDTAPGTRTGTAPGKEPPPRRAVVAAAAGVRVRGIPEVAPC